MKQSAILNTSYVLNPVCQYMSFCVHGLVSYFMCYIFPFVVHSIFTKAENDHLNMIVLEDGRRHVLWQQCEAVCAKVEHLRKAL